MAQINEYPVTAVGINAGSFFDIDQEIAPLVYESQRLPASILIGLGANIYNIDGVLTGNRVVDGGNFILKFQNLKDFQVDSNQVNISANNVGGNVNLNTNTDGALVIPSSPDPDVNVTTPVNAMIKYDSTDHDIRAYVGGAWVSLLGGGGNNIYTGDDNLLGNRAVGMGAFSLIFSGNKTTFKGINTLAAQFSLIAENSDASHRIYYNNAGKLQNTGDIMGNRLGTLGAIFGGDDKLKVVGGDVRFLGAVDVNLFHLDENINSIGMGAAANAAYKLQVTGNFSTIGTTVDMNADNFTLTHTGADYAVINQTVAGGVQQILQLKGVGAIAMEFLSTASATAIRLYKGNGGLLETNLPGGLDGYINATAGNLGLGHNAPTSKFHMKNGDFRIEGTTDGNLLFLDESSNQLSIGSTPYANVKASVTNTEGVTHSFLVLNQATTFEFSVREAGFVYTNGILSAGNAAPTSASKVQATGDIEVSLDTGWYYMGDPTTDNSWRMGFNGATDLVFERRIAGVWTNKDTIAG